MFSLDRFRKDSISDDCERMKRKQRQRHVEPDVAPNTHSEVYVGRESPQAEARLEKAERRLRDLMEQTEILVSDLRSIVGAAADTFKEPHR